MNICSNNNGQSSLNETCVNNALHQESIGVLGVASNGKCAFVNQYALKVLGYSEAKEIINKDISELIQPEKAKCGENSTEILEIGQQLNKGQSIFNQAAFIRLKDNTLFPIKYWLTQLQENDSGINALIAIQPKSINCQTDHLSEDIFGQCKTLIDTTNMIFWEYDLNSRCINFVSPKIVSIFGYPLTSWYSKAFWDKNIHPDDQKYVYESSQALSKTDKNFTLEYRMINAQNEVVYIRDFISVVHIADGDKTLHRGFFEDITREKIQAQELKLTSLAFEQSEAIVITDVKGIIVKVNKAFCQQSGYSKDECLGKDINLLKSTKHHDQAYYKKMWKDISKYSHWQGEIWNKSKSGEQRPYWLNISAVRNDSEQISHYIGIYSDLSEQKAAKAYIEYQANYDPLTHLANRELLFQSLVYALNSTQGNNRAGALILLALDDFQFINDSLGHDVGDQLLCQIGERLSKRTSKGDLVARVAGDEFAILVPMMGLDKLGVEASALDYARSIKKSLLKGFTVSTHKIFMTVGIGIAIFHNTKAKANDIFRQSDIALFHAKREGKDGLCFFTSKMSSAVKSEMSIRNEMMNALDNGQIKLYLQPVLDNELKLTCAEVLIRWQHPEKGAISPVEFIPIAEKTGLILKIGNWVFKKSCELMAKWLSQGKVPVKKLAINVSYRQFSNPEFLALVKRCLKKYNVPANYFEFELTEEVLVGDLASTSEIFNEVKKMGISIAIDDFGTGYSSLSYLKGLPIDKLKIDRSFVMDIPQDKNDTAIVKTIIAMALTLDLEVTAEGVETLEQVQILQSLNCNFLQGFYYSEPLPIAAFERFANEYRKNSSLYHQ